MNSCLQVKTRFNELENLDDTFFKKSFASYKFLGKKLTAVTSQCTPTVQCVQGTLTLIQKDTMRLTSCP